jgi:hypothetical protein
MNKNSLCVFILIIVLSAHLDFVTNLRQQKLEKSNFERKQDQVFQQEVPLPKVENVNEKVNAEFVQEAPLSKLTDNDKKGDSSESKPLEEKKEEKKEDEKEDKKEETEEKEDKKEEKKEENVEKEEDKDEKSEKNDKVEKTEKTEESKLESKKEESKEEETKKEQPKTQEPQKEKSSKEESKKEEKKEETSNKKNRTLTNKSAPPKKYNRQSIESSIEFTLPEISISNNLHSLEYYYPYFYKTHIIEYQDILDYTLLSNSCTDLGCKWCDLPSGSICSECHHGFYLYNGSCYTICPENYVADVFKNKCTPITVSSKLIFN